MDEELLRLAPPEDVIRWARERGFSTVEIVRIVSGCLGYRDALAVAKKYSPLLEISVKEFMELRKNE